MLSGALGAHSLIAAVNGKMDFGSISPTAFLTNAGTGSRLSTTQRCHVAPKVIGRLKGTAPSRKNYLLRVANDETSYALANFALDRSHCARHPTACLPSARGTMLRSA